MKSLITSLIKQGCIYYDQDGDLLCDSLEASDSPDYCTIAAVWVLLDFKEAVVYHTSGEFPVKLHFFSKNEAYEVIYVGLEQEILISKQASDTVRSRVIIGLGARLQVFQNKLIRQITSYDEIDLTLPVPVHILTDELANTGAILELNKKISVCRSRGLSISCIFQNLALLLHQ